MSARTAVGVLGGTFDPVHLGHLAIAERVLEATALPRVLFVPAALPPHKQPHGLTAARDRVAMLRLAVAEQEHLEISSIEVDTGRVCYTVDTLRRIRRDTAGFDPVFVLGMDSLVDLPTWRDFLDLILEFDLVVVDRPDRTLHSMVRRLHPAVAQRVRPLEPAKSGAERLGRGGRIVHVSIAPIPVSSSEIRLRAAMGLSLAGLVPPQVAGYIQSKQLYRQEDGN